MKLCAKKSLKNTSNFNRDYKSLEGRLYIKLYLWLSPVVNHPGITRLIMDVVNEIRTELKVMDKPVMIGEDFAYYGRYVPAGYFFLGCGSKEKSHPLHQSSFDIEEACLPLGVRVMTQFVYRFLEE